MNTKEQQECNRVSLRTILENQEIAIYPAGLDGNAYAPTKKRPAMRFGVAISKDAFEGKLAALDQWHMVIVFYRQPCPEKSLQGGRT